MLSHPPDEEAEEDLTVEQMEEKARAGDARAQTRVRKADAHGPNLGFVVSPAGSECLFLFSRKTIADIRYDPRHHLDV